MYALLGAVFPTNQLELPEEVSQVGPVTEQGSAIADRTPIFSLLGANAVSQVGDMMVAVAMPWFVLETTDSAAKTGLTGAAIGVGAILPVVLGGPLVDRLGFKRASVLADLTRFHLSGGSKVAAKCTVHSVVE